MRIIDLLSQNAVCLGASASGREEALDRLIALQGKAGNLSDAARYRADLLAREELGSTAIGNGIAVPHAKSGAVLRPGLAAMTVPGGIDFGAPDKAPSDLFFMIAAPEGAGDSHLEILSRLMVMLMDEPFCERLRRARSPKEFLTLIDAQEREKYPEQAPEKAKGSDGRLVLAVTACPTGIAHTYMAAEALEKKGRELGVTVRAETQGSGGAKNVLTRDEIAACAGVIIAADKEVALDRFDGKPLLKVPVSAGINQPEELIQKILAGQAPVYRRTGGFPQQDGVHESAGRAVYKQLMNGVSHMLPFVIGGGILIALAFLFDAGALNEENLSNFGTITPLAAFLKNIGGAAFGFMLPILAGYIAMAVADRPGLAAGFVGGTLAVSGATFSHPAGTDVSAGFLGALIAGFAAGYFVLGLRRFCDRVLPAALEGIKPVLIYPLVGILVIGVVMCAVNPFVGMLNAAIFDALGAMGTASRVLLGCVLAGMMAVDMGGPFNKAAYVFGTATLTAAAGPSEVMAAVMIGGMVPPLAIALAASFFPDRFTPEERKSGPVNYVMGLCFITEGAIPFAASDPLRVLPACIAGSAVAGGISMAMGCALPAPHGGIFVLPVMTGVLWYLIALAAGSVIGMMLLALLKNKRPAGTTPARGE